MFECPGEGERLENICDLATTGVSRTTAGQIIQRQFRELLDRADLKVDKHTGKEHELYSLRDTAHAYRQIARTREYFHPRQKRRHICRSD